MPTEQVEEQKETVESDKTTIKNKVIKIVTRIFLVIAIIAFIGTTSIINSLFYSGCRDLAGKPVIYLYPEEETDIKIELRLNGELNTVYPSFNNRIGDNKATWMIKAKPDGALIDSKNRQYNYLFWEGYLDSYDSFKTGYCIKGSETEAFLENKLTELGLNYKEQNDFITYWLPKMQNNEYNLITFNAEEYTKNTRIKTTPAFDSEIRVFMTWKATDKFIDIPEDKIQTPEREEFTLVEWGGVEIKQ